MFFLLLKKKDILELSLLCFGWERGSKCFKLKNSSHSESIKCLFPILVILGYNAWIYP